MSENEKLTLEEWLRKKRIFTKFKDAFNSSSQQCNIDHYLCEYSERIDAITLAFDWSKTADGHKFWLNMRYEWYKNIAL